MKCPKCGAGNPSKNKFCGECGANLQKVSIKERIDLVKKIFQIPLLRKLC